MKQFDWDDKKNSKLIAERCISFEEVILAIEQGHILDVISHPNQRRYENQMMLVVKINQYAYLVPYVEGEERTFLKTIIPSRKATKKYITGGGSKND